MKDLYTRVAEKTGVDRQIVKSLALTTMYKAGAPETEEALEQALVKEIEGHCPPHRWDRSGERCEKCGDKDWMT